jgi:hypothetical protein
MAIGMGIWRISNADIVQIKFSRIDSERKLEDVLTKKIEVISEDLLLLGRQICTSYGKVIDMLAIDGDGKTYILELKRNRTPREVVAQGIDYASWVQNLSYQEIKTIFEENNHPKLFETAFSEKFGNELPEKINEEHQITIVCAELDDETERIINYLANNYGVPLNAVFFRFFKEGQGDYLTRTWLIDPYELKEAVIPSRPQSKGEAWNGLDFVVNIDVDAHDVSSWDDCKKYGFVSAGGGKWYSNTLKALFPGARVFAMLPGKGYLGVGEVLDRRVPGKEFIFNGKSILDLPLKAKEILKDADDPEKCEYFVRIKWLEAYPENKAYWENGMRANQNSAFKLKSSFTLEKLVKHFKLEK